MIKAFIFTLLILITTQVQATETWMLKDWRYKPHAGILKEKPDGYPHLTVAGGCFWCVESEFRRLEGVLFTEAGYAGGKIEDATYGKVSTGTTQHREVVQITFDPAIISYSQLVEFFMTQAHDPTQKNGQGPNIGFQYSSAIYAEGEQQRKEAERVIENLKNARAFRNEIATAIEPYTTYVRAEDYHQGYYEAYEEKTGDKHINILIKEEKAKRKLKQDRAN
jgi:methionine-S-sulfoxide reductase